jgi:hypothetical protein
VSSGETDLGTGECNCTAVSALPLVSFQSRLHGGALRGCIGTIEPIKQTLAEELIANAINAATRDPRFDPVCDKRTPGLRYSVDVWQHRSRLRFADLDPKFYGVIVEDETGKLRGLLLPDIAEWTTATKQVEIASRKPAFLRGHRCCCRAFAWTASVRKSRTDILMSFFYSQPSRQCVYLDVQISYVERVVLDELAPRLDGIAHQHGEDLIRFNASSILTCNNVRFSGFMVVSQSCSGFISPRPL